MIRRHYRSQLHWLLAVTGLLLASGAFATGPLYRLTGVRSGTFTTFSPRVSLTDDGRGICFDGRSYGYWTGDMFLPDSVGVWRYDFTSHFLALLTRSAGGQYPKGRCQRPVISGDGNVILFDSSATDLTPTPLPDGLYAYDLVKGGYDRCDVASDGVTFSDRGFSSFCLSRDGRYVAFVTMAKLASNDNNDTNDLYLRDRLAHRTTLQSVSTAGAQGTGDDLHIECAISADGKAIVFTSDAVGLVPEVVTPMQGVYLRRLPGDGTTTLVSTTNWGAPASGWYPSISGDGRSVAFCSPAAGLAVGDVTGNWDVFVVDTVADVNHLASQPIKGSTAASGDSNTGVGCPALSYDGRYVVFHSNNQQVFSKVPTAASKWQVVLRDLFAENTTVMSSPDDGAYGNDDSYPAAISANGDRVAFLSEASNLVGGDTNGYRDVFARRASYAIYGKVETPAEKPLQYTSVLAINKGTNAEHWTYCGADGRYCISGLTSGDYDVWAYKAGHRFAPASHTLMLNGLTREQDFVGSPATGDGIVTYRALLVGISKYWDSRFDLTYCDQDARDVRSALLTGVNWKAANIQLLLNKAATRAATKKAIADLMARCDGDDVCVIWWSSHGDKMADRAPFDEDDGDATLLPSNDKPISDDEFGHWLNRCGTADYLLGLDCCFSGGQIKTPGTALASVRQFDWLAGFLSDFRGSDLGTKDLDDNHCGAVLASSSSEQTSQESAWLENGIFTHFVVEGIGNRLADEDKDKWITPSEMMTYARQKTIDENASLHRTQTPTKFAQGGALDLPIIGTRATPDLRLAEGSDELLGGNIFSSNGVHQGTGVGVDPGTNVTWRIVIANASASARRVRVKGMGGNRSFPLRYVDADGGNADITAAVTGDGWLTPSMPPKGLYRLTLKVKTPVTPGATLNRQLITGAFADNEDRSDTVAVELWINTPDTVTPSVTGLTAAPTGVGAEISFALRGAAQVQVRLLNLAGRPVRTLLPGGRLEAGTQRLLWNGRGDSGTVAPQGVYLVEVSARTDGGAFARTITSLRR